MEQNNSLRYLKSGKFVTLQTYSEVTDMPYFCGGNQYTLIKDNQKSITNVRNNLY